MLRNDYTLQKSAQCTKPGQEIQSRLNLPNTFSILRVNQLLPHTGTLVRIFWRIVLSLFLFQTVPIRAQTAPEAASHWTFLPGRPIFPTLPASYEEPRTGIIKDGSTAHMKLDIGSSLELLEFRLREDSTERIHFGAELFTYALTTSNQGLRLQVDAVDGYFGGHVTYRLQHSRSAYALRLRILHLSSHFLDGHYDLHQNMWLNGLEPTPLARDYGELTGAYIWGSTPAELMVYAGFSQATLIRPPTMKRLNVLCGFSAHTGNWIGPLFGSPVHVYAADHYSLWGLEMLSGTNMFEAGVKLGGWDSSGIRIFLSHHAGLEVFHQYFDTKDADWGMGFAFDL